MSYEAMVVAPQDRPTALNVVGEKITVLASGDQTGSYEIFVHDGPEGTGPPPHSHAWDEAFFVLKGEVQFSVGDAEQTAVAGTLVQVPGGTTHWFRLGAGGAEMLGLTSRAGASELFTDIDRNVPADAPDLGAVIAIAAAHGLTVPIPQS